MTRAAAILLTVALVAPALASPALAGNASLTLGFQDRRLDIDTGLVPDLDPIGNDQTSVRAVYTWDLDERFTVVAQGGFASSYLELTDERLNGFTDLRLRGLWRPGDTWAIGFGTIVPMGLYELSAAEVTTAQWTWNPRSDFPLNAFGSGWGWEVTAARAFALSPTVTAGVAGAFLRHAEFQFLDTGDGDYRLGDEASVSGSLDLDLGGGRRARGVVALKLFGSDRVNGTDYVDQGNQVDLGVHLDLPTGDWFTAWGARLMLKGDNSIEIAASADSVARFSQAPGTYITLEGRAGRSVSRSASLYLEAVLHTVTGSDYTIGADGSSISFGPGLGWRLAEPFTVSARYAFITGGGDDDLSFDGRDLLVTLEYRP